MLKKYMKKIIFKKIAFSVIIITLIISFFRLASFSRAEDDEERGGDDDYYRQPAAQTTPPQVIEQQIIQPLSTINTPKIIAPKDSTVAPKSEPFNNVSSTVVDNTAILTALKDSDQDGIPDPADKHPGQDDFSFSLLDNNHNGIADDLEQLLK